MEYIFPIALLLLAVLLWQSSSSIGQARHWFGAIGLEGGWLARVSTLGVFSGIFRIAALLLVMASAYLFLQEKKHTQAERLQMQARFKPEYDPNSLWQAPDLEGMEWADDAELIRYGRDLVAHTQDYFGEVGLVRPGSINGLNCQNCHLDAGAKPWGNNYAAVQSMYPLFRERSGSEETIAKRVNDCFERSLDGQPLDTTGREMQAIKAYISWLGQSVPVKVKPKGSGIWAPEYLDRAADPVRGEAVYVAKCQSCHGPDGQGLPIPESARDYPPLWGPRSYAESAGLFRLSRFAGYVKANMPLGATWDNPQLTDEEAWDVAAFINSQPRPKHRFLDADFSNLAGKPFDHPFGPYADTFPENQHKDGPFQPIIAAKKAK
jgi:thiosulfate dehydrogenase